MPKRVNPANTVQISFRVPSAIAGDIDKLIKAGLYKDRADFSYRAVLDYLQHVQKSRAGKSVELEIPLGIPDE